MDGINRSLVTSGMPVNCGMKDMHEGITKNQRESSMPQLDEAISTNNIPMNCGMKSMPEDNTSKQERNNSKNIIEYTKGTKIDVRV